MFPLVYSFFDNLLLKNLWQVLLYLRTDSGTSKEKLTVICGCISWLYSSRNFFLTGQVCNFSQKEKLLLIPFQIFAEMEG
jgi:hypothetical protein